MEVVKTVNVVEETVAEGVVALAARSDEADGLDGREDVGSIAVELASAMLNLSAAGAALEDVLATADKAGEVGVGAVVVVPADVSETLVRLGEVKVDNALVVPMAGMVELPLDVLEILEVLGKGMVELEAATGVILNGNEYW